MQEVIIVCEDSFGLDVKYVIDAINDEQRMNGWEILYTIKGYITPQGCEYRTGLLEYLGSVEPGADYRNEIYVMGIRNPQHKCEVARIMESGNASFTAIRAPWVMDMPEFEYPKGCVIAAFCVKENAEIGEYVTLFNSMLGATKIGKYSSAMSYSNLTTAEIGERVYIGPNAVIMDHVRVGDDAVVEPNSVVVRNVKAGTRVNGIPARKEKEKE